MGHGHHDDMSGLEEVASPFVLVDMSWTAERGRPSPPGLLADMPTICPLNFKHFTLITLKLYGVALQVGLAHRSSDIT